MSKYVGGLPAARQTYICLIFEPLVKTGLASLAEQPRHTLLVRTDKNEFFDTNLRFLFCSCILERLVFGAVRPLIGMSTCMQYCKRSEVAGSLQPSQATGLVGMRACLEDINNNVKMRL